MTDVAELIKIWINKELSKIKLDQINGVHKNNEQFTIV